MDVDAVQSFIAKVQIAVDHGRAAIVAALDGDLAEARGRLDEVQAWLDKAQEMLDHEEVHRDE